MWPVAISARSLHASKQVVNTFVTIMGWVCIALICLAALAVAVSFAATAVQKMLERFEWAIDSKTRHEVGRSIGASAHWFGESPDTYLAIRILAERLINQGGADAHQWREQWRQQIAARTTDKATSATGEQS